MFVYDYIHKTQLGQLVHDINTKYTALPVFDTEGQATDETSISNLANIYNYVYNCDGKVYGAWIESGKPFKPTRDASGKIIDDEITIEANSTQLVPNPIKPVNKSIELTYTTGYMAGL